MFIDIAFNITSKEFEGRIDEIIERCKHKRTIPLLVGLDIESSLKCIEYAEKYNTFCFFGIHPLHLAFDQKLNVQDLLDGYSSVLKEKKILENRRVVGLGECGLDYYRASNRDEQIKVFKYQLEMGKSVAKPYFLHCRSAYSDIEPMIDNIRGVVHSFDGTWEDAERIMARGLYIGINGCSLRTEDSCSVVEKIPLDRILLETDSPYCLIRKSYAASKYVTVSKLKCNEPSNIEQIAEAIANIKGITTSEVESKCFENTLKLFPEIESIVKDWVF